MHKAFNIVSAVLFFTVIAMFAIGTILLPEKSFTLDGSFTESAEKYVTENFPLFENWRSMYSSFISATGQKRIGNVYISDRGLIEITNTINEKQISSRIESINSLYEKYKHTPIYVMIAPTASGIYSSELSMSVNEVDQQKVTDDIYFRIDASVQTLDAYNPLFTARDDYIYFRTDNRWTAYGAYTAYNKIIRKMGFTPVRLSNYDMEYADRSFYGELYAKTHYNGVRADIINIFRNKNGSFVTRFTALKGDEIFTSSSIYYSPALDTKDKLDLFLGGSDFDSCTITTSNVHAPKLLLLNGRYANIFVPFLTPHYSEITMIDPSCLYDGTLEEKINISDYDQILLLTDFAEFCE